MQQNKVINASHKNFIQVGDFVTFIYHGKRREGTVEKAASSFVTLKYETANGTEFKSFNFDKMS